MKLIKSKKIMYYLYNTAIGSLSKKKKKNRIKSKKHRKYIYNEVYTYEDLAKSDLFKSNNNICTSTDRSVVKLKFLEGCQIYKIM